MFRLLAPDTSGGLIDDYEQWFNGPNRLLAFRGPNGAIYIAGSFPIPEDSTSAGVQDGGGVARLLYPRRARVQPGMPLADRRRVR